MSLLAMALGATLGMAAGMLTALAASWSVVTLADIHSAPAQIGICAVIGMPISVLTLYLLTTWLDRR